MPDNNELNRDYLATVVVDGMGLDDLCAAMAERISQDYKLNEDAFQEDWEVYCDDLTEAPQEE
jgi:hypothetical protein